MTRPVVLTVLLDVPTPAVTGLHLRMLGNLALVRALGCESHVLYFTTEESVGDPEKMRGLHDGATAAGLRRPYATFSVKDRIVQRAGFTLRAVSGKRGRTYPYSLSYDAADGAQRVEAAAVECSADVVILPSILVHYAPALIESGHQVIADAPDVLTDLSWRFLQRYGRRRPSHLPGLLANFLGCRSQERLFFRSCAEVWVTSSEEADQVRRLAPGTRVIVVPNSVDEQQIVASPLPEDDSVGFIGTYGYTPNLDAAVHLVDRVFPEVLGRVPSARLRLAGAGMPAALAERFSATGYVDVLGRVGDAASFTRSCAVLAFPVSLRGGVPLKLLEGMAAARPVVASPELVSGLGLGQEHEIVIAADPTAMAEGIVRLLQDRSSAAAMGATARRVFEERFSLSTMIRTAGAHSILSGATRAHGR
jgi:glycosyltransferase involved in cell wall biosynthesis